MPLLLGSIVPLRLPSPALSSAQVQEALGKKYLINAAYERGLTRG